MTALRVAGSIYLLLGIGFGGGAVVTLLHFARHGELPVTPWGFRSMSGPFEGLGAERFSMLGWSFVAVCALDALAGVWLWQGHRRGVRLGMLTSPLAFVLGLGFALPILIVGVPVRLGLTWAGRGSLR
ncbi:MAG TPA: hypothetical protein VFQ81_11090 [Candidatus Limnocylindria bacterium]|nr:hypothetical protein [Candidatus Limnocylindria bacterium]